MILLQIEKWLKNFSDTAAFVFYSYCVGFLVPVYFLARYVFAKTYLEYMIFMIILCPFSYWVWQLFKKK